MFTSMRVQNVPVTLLSICIVLITIGGNTNANSLLDLGTNDHDHAALIQLALGDQSQHNSASQHGSNDHNTKFIAVDSNGIQETDRNPLSLNKGNVVFVSGQPLHTQLTADSSRTLSNEDAILLATLLEQRDPSLADIQVLTNSHQGFSHSDFNSDPLADIQVLPNSHHGLSHGSSNDALIFLTALEQ